MSKKNAIPAMFRKSPPLPEKDCTILKGFIQNFLPPKGNKRTSEGNELSYIGSTLSRIFHKYLNIHLEDDQVLDVFEQLGYQIFLFNGDYDTDTKVTTKSEHGNLVRLNKGYYQKKAYFIYVDVSASLVRDLRLVTSGLLPSARPELHQAKQALISRILLFKDSCIK